MRMLSRQVGLEYWILAACLFARGLSGISAQAQALPAAIGPGSYLSIGGGISAFPSAYDMRTLGGTMIFMDFQPTFRYGFEGEARFLRYHEDEGVDQTNYLAGIHVGTRPQRLRPYAKFLVGATKIDAPFGYGQGTFFTLVPGAGVDYVLNDRFAARIVDIEYQIIPQFIASNVRTVGLSIGLSYRINGLGRLPKGGKLR